MFKLLDPTELSACIERMYHFINVTKYNFEFILNISINCFMKRKYLGLLF